MKINLNTGFIQIIIIFISLIYGFLNGSGFYGYNIDYYYEYSQNNLRYKIIFDKLGIILSTLTINEIHIGVYLTSFIISFSAGNFTYKCFEINRENKVVKKNIYYSFYLFIYLLILHIHPSIMSTSGAMRQAWVMSLIFLCLIFIMDRKFFFFFICSFLMIFMHKSGIIFFFYFILTFISFYILNKIKSYYDQLILLVFFGIIFLLALYLFLYGLKINKIFFTYERIVRGDFRLFWFFINLIYICIYLYLYNTFSSSLFKLPALFIYFSFWGNICFFLVGYNDQYERLNMIIGVASLLILALMMRNFFYIITLTGFIFYFFLTIYQGMYTIGLY